MARKFNIFTGRWDEIGTQNTATGTVTSISAGVGITLTPNPITSTGTVAQSNTAVTPGTYGDATHVGQFTVDQQGNLTFAANVAISDPADGTVTSVAQTVPPEFTISGSPITTSGTLAIGKANENANTVWAGPTSGAAAQPTFRSLVFDDVPFTWFRMVGTAQASPGRTSIINQLLIAEGTTGTTLTIGNTNGECFMSLATNNITNTVAGWTTADTFTRIDVNCDYFMRVIPVDTAASVRYWLGLSPFAPTGGPGNNPPDDFNTWDGIWFRFSTSAGDVNWQTITRAGASLTVKDSGVAVVANTAYTLRISVNSTGSIDFYINGTLVTNHTTSIVTTASLLGFQLGLTALAAAVKTIKISRIWCIAKLP